MIGAPAPPFGIAMRRRALENLAARLGLPEGLWTDGQNGLRADLEGDALVRLGWERDGAPDGGEWLGLDPGARSGRLVSPQGSGGTADYEVYADGSWESFDAWSDNSRPQRMSWSGWTRRSAAAVMGRVPCLLCGLPLSRRRAAAHTADRRAHVCGPCKRRIEAEAPTGRSWPRGDRVCAACGRDHEDDAPLFEGPSGKLCPPCAAALRPAGVAKEQLRGR